MLCFGTCICCAIEALGKFQTGILASGNSGKNFKAFVRAYMDPRWFQNHFAARPYVDYLWANFRNGLAHGFTIKEGGFERHASYFQVKAVSGVQQLELDPDKLRRDFELGLSRFIADITAVNDTDPAFQRFHHAFQGIFVLGQ